MQRVLTATDTGVESSHINSHIHTLTNWRFTMKRLITATVTGLLMATLISTTTFAAKPGGGGSTTTDAVDLRSWSKKIDDATQRFIVLGAFNNKAVLDIETGLVWERSPDTTPRPWHLAIAYCAGLQVGGRRGWHLPLIEQLASLVDTTNNYPALPTGHPFSNVQNFVYWSATTNAAAQQDARTLFFTDGHVDVGYKNSPTPNYWCVRGGQSFDGNTHDMLH